MLTITATAVAVAGCVVLAAFRGPRWLLVAAAVGATGYTIVKRCRVL